MRIIEEPLPGVKLIELRPFGDSRGSFTETYNRAKMEELGIRGEFVQDNESVSTAPGTIRGLHLQLAPHAQGKLVRVLSGAVLDVAVDLRPTSPAYRQSCAVTLRGDDDRAFWIPEGFGHGFCTLEPNTTVAYKVTALYAPESDRSIRWDDPAIAIDWPIGPGAAILSEKDSSAPDLASIESELA